ncbi:MAG: tol-pal system-associated acyl-CoA thioesterase [Gammaproteobacteria bacterium]
MGQFVLPVRVYLEDTDAQGVVYNASYFRYLERARTEWLRDHGVEHNRVREQEGVIFVLVGIEVRFTRPARLDDMLYITAELAKLKGARVILDQSVRRESPDGELLCRGVAEVACLDPEQLRPRRVPAILVSALRQ